MEIKAYGTASSLTSATPSARRADVDASTPEKRVDGAVPVRDPGVVARVNGSAEGAPVYSKPRESRLTGGAGTTAKRLESESTSVSDDLEVSSDTGARVNLKQLANSVQRAATADSVDASSVDVEREPSSRGAAAVSAGPQSDDPQALLDHAEQILTQIAARSGGDEGERQLAAKAVALQAAAREELHEEQTAVLEENQAQAAERRKAVMQELAQKELALKEALRQAQQNDSVEDPSALLAIDAVAKQVDSADIETTPDTETDEAAEAQASDVALAKNAYTEVERTGVPTVSVSNARSSSVLVAIDRIVGTATDTSSTNLYLVA